MRAGMLEVSGELLEKALNLPEDQHIERILSGPTAVRTFLIVVSGPTMPEVPEGASPPLIVL